MLLFAIHNKLPFLSARKLVLHEMRGKSAFLYRGDCTCISLPLYKGEVLYENNRN